MEELDSVFDARWPARASTQKIKVAVNAGSSDTGRLHDDLNAIIQSQELDLKVAYVEGDEVFEAVENAISEGDTMQNLTTGTVILHAAHNGRANSAQDNSSTIGSTSHYTHSAILVVSVLWRLSSWVQI